MNALIRKSIPLALAWLVLSFFASASAQEIAASAQAQIQALLSEKALRTPAQAKMTSQLVHAAKMLRGESLAPGMYVSPGDMESVHLDARNFVDLDIQANVTADLLAFIQSLGGTVVNAFAEYRAIRAQLPLLSVEQLAARSEVQQIHQADQGHTNRQSASERTKTAGFGAQAAMPVSSVSRQSREALATMLHQQILQGSAPIVTSAGPDGTGDIAHQANLVRYMYRLDGSGVKIGVLSNGVDSLAMEKAAGRLPATVNVISGQAGTGNEGTAMLEILYTLAPGATLYFATGNGGQGQMAANIQALADAGCNVIIDDITYYLEGVFQDDIIARKVNQVAAAGVFYFSSAANSGSRDKGTSGTWEGDFTDSGATIDNLPESGTIHGFGNATDDTLTAVGAAGVYILNWSDPLGASNNDYDLFILNATMTSVLASSTNIQNGTQNPQEGIGASVPAGSRIVILNFQGSAQIRALHLDTARGRLSIATEGNTYGHNAASGAFTIAAVDVHTAAGGVFSGGTINPAETFSSDGPRRMFYNKNGSEVTPGNVLFSTLGGVLLPKPDLTAADGVPTGVTGFTLFYGTSAAAPHAGAIAALIIQAKPDITLAQMQTALTSTALDIEAAGWDRVSGAGIMMALPAVQSLFMGAPAAATLISPTGAIGTSTPTYTWTAVSNATWYELWVDDSTMAGKIQTWYTAAQAGCASGTGTCSVTPSTALTAGSAWWSIDTWNDHGIGPWSAALAFTAQGAPAPAILISPAGTINTDTPTYAWNAVFGATWYLLWASDSTTGGKIQTWYTAAEVGCASGTGTCSVKPILGIVDGSATWWIEPWNSYGLGPWSAALAFTVTGPPGAAMLISPSGLIGTLTPTYTWNAVPRAKAYQLNVNDADSPWKIETFYTPEQAGCASGTGTCSVTPTTALAAGPAYWWIEPFNSYGTGSVYYGMSFTAAGSPAAATLVSPSSAVFTTTPTYTWNAVSNATWYELWVNDSVTYGKIQNWYTAAQAGCPSGTGTCSVTPNTALAAGPAKWWIDTWNTYGYGPWSAETAFAVAVAASPAAATLISPAGTIGTHSPTYTWNAVPNATWYELWVDDSVTNGKIQSWYTAEEAGCVYGTGICSVTPATNLASGGAMWWIETWNLYGIGPWSSGMQFTHDPNAGFNEQFDSVAASGWKQDSGVWNLEGGTYHTAGAPLNSYVTSTYNQTYSDFDLQAKLHRYAAGCQDCPISLFVRASGPIMPPNLFDGGLLQHGYLFGYTADGRFGVFRVTPIGRGILANWAYSAAINKGGEWNLLRVTARGSSLSFYINGTLVWSGSDPFETSGRVGVTMQTDQDVDGLWVDWAALTVLTNSVANPNLDHTNSTQQQPNMGAILNPHGTSRGWK